MQTIYVTEINPDNLSIKTNWQIPRSKARTGWAVLVADAFYFGASYKRPEVNGKYTLGTCEYDDTYTNRLPRGSYISQIYWNPSTNCLFVNDNKTQQIYKDVAKFSK